MGIFFTKYYLFISLFNTKDNFRRFSDYYYYSFWLFFIIYFFIFFIFILFYHFLSSTFISLIFLPRLICRSAGANQHETSNVQPTGRPCWPGPLSRRPTDGQQYTDVFHFSFEINLFYPYSFFICQKYTDKFSFHFLDQYFLFYICFSEPSSKRPTVVHKYFGIISILLGLTHLPHVRVLYFFDSNQPMFSFLVLIFLWFFYFYFYFNVYSYFSLFLSYFFIINLYLAGFVPLTTITWCCLVF